MAQTDNMLVGEIHTRENHMNHQCPICQAQTVDLFVRRENVPIHQNILFEEETQALNIPRGTLSIVICHHCGFVFNADFDASFLSYDENYENTQGYSSVFEKYLDDTIDYLINEKGIRNRRVIEVGCGKGDFLKKLVEQGENSGIGFDPSYTGPLEMLNGELRFHRRFYDESSTDLIADVIICRHVIEHIASPIEMLGTIRRALANSPHAQVFFETPDVGWILKNQVVWDFFYEHCSYFSLPSLKYAFEKSGFLVHDVKNIFEGQYFWIEAQPTPEPVALPFKGVKHLTKLARKYADADVRFRSLWMEHLVKMQARGNIAIWGAGAKGVTFANMFDPKQKLISCVIDVNPQKQNKYLPGTGHPIVSYRELIPYNIDSVLILNPNYRQEIEDLLESSGIKNIRIHEFSLDVEDENHH